MTLARACSECGHPLAGKDPRAKTCSDKCRAARSRRERRANREVEQFAAANNAGAQEIAAIVRREAPDVVKRVFQDEIRPIVREAINEDVLRAIEGMVGLTPAAVAALQEDLGSEDSTVRQKAYSLVIKYTVGHPALVKEDITKNQNMTVNFNLPRPEQEDLEQTAEAADVKECDMCHEDKVWPDEFEAASTRCKDCHEEFTAKIRAQFA